MPAINDNNPIAIQSPALIYDDSLYEREALGLEGDETENDLEQAVRAEARRLGIGYQHSKTSPEDESAAMSHITGSSEPRSSMSTGSHTSASTGLTSELSRTSKEHHREGHVSPASDYDFIVQNARPRLRHTHSASTSSTGTSSHHSLSRVLPKMSLHARRKRGSSLLSLFHLSHHHGSSRHGSRGESPVIRLDCGHFHSKDELRSLVMDSVHHADSKVPSCCGKPIPGAILETALTRDELDSLVQLLVQSYHLDGAAGEHIFGRLANRSSLEERSHPAPPPTPCSASPNAVPNALDYPSFRDLMVKHQRELQRISAFEVKQRRALSTWHEWSRRHLASRQERAKSDLGYQHARALEALEERQVSAELDLRTAQAEEKQNVATAVKYMEAYCNGSTTSGSGMKHHVSDEDRKKLEEQHMIQDKLDQKQASAINVLRARQDKNLQKWLDKQRSEACRLEGHLRQERRAQDARFTEESRRLDALIGTRRSRIVGRWDARRESWKRLAERKEGRVITCTFPVIEWPKPETTLETLSNRPSALDDFFILKSLEIIESPAT